MPLALGPGSHGSSALGGGGPKPRLLGHFCFPLGDGEAAREGHTGAPHQGGAHSKTLLSRPAQLHCPWPATWVCLYPSPLLGTYTLAGLRKWRQKGVTRAHLSQPPCLCPFQVLAMLVVYPATTLPLQRSQVSRCPAVNGEDRPLQSLGTHSPVEPLRTSACRRAHLRMFQSTKYPQHLPCLTHLPQLSLHG